MTSVAVIGAGITGLTCARRLYNAGFKVTVFDKGRGLGGRLSTRRVSELGLDKLASAAFDHGAQFMTARGEEFKRLLSDPVIKNAVSIWRPLPVHTPESSTGSASDLETSSDSEWFVGTPGMTAIAKAWAQSLSVALSTRVERLEETELGWRLWFEDETAQGPYDVVIITAPPEQAQALLPSNYENEFAAISAVRVAPCWAGLFAFESRLSVEFDILRDIPVDSGLSLVARNSSKPGRSGLDAWVVHAGPDWSIANLERSPSEIAPQLLHAFFDAVQINNVEPVYASAHRWRFARTTETLGKPFLSNRAGTLFVGGDWCLGARVECGFDSGAAIANALVWEAGFGEHTNDRSIGDELG